MAALNANDNFEACPHPARFEIVDKDGKIVEGREFINPKVAAVYAHAVWPDQEQDPDRTGAGWDIQKVGAK